MRQWLELVRVTKSEELELEQWANACGWLVSPSDRPGGMSYATAALKRKAWFTGCRQTEPPKRHSRRQGSLIVRVKLTRRLMDTYFFERLFVGEIDELRLAAGSRLPKMPT
jgi:hypothetical protein